jgi:hypothetical protein
MIAGVVDNGVSPDDPRVLIRCNEATKIIPPCSSEVATRAVRQIRRLLRSRLMKNFAFSFNWTFGRAYQDQSHLRERGHR